MLGSDDAAGRSPEIGRMKVGHHRRNSSYSYQRLIEPSYISLSVLKLDGSVFEVQVGKNDSVWDLKVAVEEFFFPILKDEGISVSWSHVWSHFCLCYKNQKLTDEKASLRSIGIRDGDQLRFVQHLSINYLSKGKSKSRHRLEHRRSFASPELLTEDEREKITELKRSNSFGDVGIYEIALEDENNDEISTNIFKSNMFFRGWFSYSRLKSSTSKNKPSKRRENVFCI